MSRVIVVAEHKLIPRFAVEFSALVRQHAKRCVEIEPGCLHFSVSRDLKDKDRWHYCEIYASQNDFDVHCASSHFLEHMERVKHMIDGEVIFSTSSVVAWSSRTPVT
jgi:quinol monooxygenase YgiN